MNIARVPPPFGTNMKSQNEFYVVKVGGSIGQDPPTEVTPF